MTTPKVALSHPVIKLNGSNLDKTLRNKIEEIEVDTSLGVPDMFLIRFEDDEMEASAKFNIGDEVEISAEKDSAVTSIMTGEITGIEFELIDNRSSFIIRGYDLSHRMSIGTKIAVYKEVKHSEIVSTIMGDYSDLSADVEATTTVYEHVFQDNVSDRDFIEELARLNGYLVQVRDGKLLFKKQPTSSEITLKAGEDLYRFHGRINATGQVGKVIVTGWDPSQKSAVTGEKSSSRTHASIDHSDSSSGADAAGKIKSDNATYTYYAPQATTQGAANDIAQAILDEINEKLVEADATAIGNPKLIAGIKVTIENAGKFSGTYLVTSAVHTFTPHDDYQVQFRVEGSRSRGFGDLLNGDNGLPGQQRSGGLWSGVVPALVTNNTDEEDIGRVKVKFPWLNDDLESTWARLVGVGGANESGIQWYPQVNDEVLIAFDNGDFNRPYVIGSMWNGTDKAPHTASEATMDGDDIRIIKTPAGHLIRFTDKEGSEMIEIMDKDAENTITFDTSSQELTITTTGKMNLEAADNITIKSDADIVIDAGGDVKVDGSNIKLNASAKMEAKGSSSAEVSSSGTMTVKGATVKIN